MGCGFSTQLIRFRFGVRPVVKNDKGIIHIYIVDRMGKSENYLKIDLVKFYIENYV